MQDAQQLSQLFAKDSSFQMDSYSDVQWIYCTDSSTGSGSIQFDTLPLMSQPTVFSEGFIVAPVSFYSSNVSNTNAAGLGGFGGDYRGAGLRPTVSGGVISASPDACTKMAFKGGNFSMITGVQVQLQSGPTIVNDSSSPWFLNQIRPAVECSNDALATVGSEGQLFAPKFPHYFRSHSHNGTIFTGAGINAFGVQEGDTLPQAVARQRTSWSQVVENSSQQNGNTNTFTIPLIYHSSHVISASVVSSGLPGTPFSGMTVGATCIIQTPSTLCVGTGSRPATLQLTATSASTISIVVIDGGAGIASAYTGTTDTTTVPTGLNTFSISGVGGLRDLNQATTGITADITIRLGGFSAVPSVASAGFASGTSKNPYYNRGYQLAVRSFWQNFAPTGAVVAVNGGNATVWAGDIIIRLKDIHDAFNALNWPIINTRLTLTFTLASPFNVSSNIYALQLGPEVAPPFMSLGKNPTVQYRGGECRLYVKQVRFSASDALKMQQRLSSGFQKSLTFLEGEATPLPGFQNSVAGSINVTLNLATTNAKRVWLFGAPVGPLFNSGFYNNIPGFTNGAQNIGQPYAPITGVARLSSANLLVNQKPWRDLNYSIEPEFWIALRNQMRGGGESWAEGSQISYDDWLNGYRLLYVWDLQRVGNRLDKNQPIQLSINATRVADLNGSAFMPVDWWLLIEKEANVQIMISAASASVAKTY
jgi:hypothetical protein